MIIVVMLIVCILAGLSLLGRNKYKSLVTFYCVTFVAMLLVANLYISKVTSYHFLTEFDYKLYYLFSRIPLHISDISRVYNLCFGLFMYVSLYIGANFFKWSPKFYCILILPIILFLYLADPTTTRDIFLIENTRPNFQHLGIIVNHINLSLVHIYTLFPLVAILYRYFKSSIFIKRFHLLGIFFIVLLIISYFFAVFIYGTYKSILFSSVSAAKLPAVDTVGFYSSAELIITILMIVLLCFVIIIDPFKYYDYMPKRAAKKNTKLLDKNLSMLLHTYKNSFWCIAQQLNEIKVKLDEGDFQKASKYADNSFNVAKENFDNISSMLLVLNNNKRLLFKPVSLFDCIENAISSISLPGDVSLINNFSPENDISIMGSKPHICEMFVNIFSNSIDSHKSSKKPGKHIMVDFITEDELCMVTITDNGCGIESSNLRKIFNLFYSTKSPSTNSGIGLNYVKNVVSMHKGDIRIKSHSGEYTKVEIVFSKKH